MKRTRIVDRRRMEGHDIKRGRVLFVAETRKGTDYYEAKVSGVLSKILVVAGEFVDLPTFVGTITSDGEEP